VAICPPLSIDPNPPVFVPKLKLSQLCIKIEPPVKTCCNRAMDLACLGMKKKFESVILSQLSLRNSTPKKYDFEMEKPDLYFVISLSLDHALSQLSFSDSFFLRQNGGLIFVDAVQIF
jgi:hypothetical protein